MEDSLINEIWESIVSFGGYGFNKSHAVSYAIQSYQDAWLKAYYPGEFYTSLLSKDPSLIKRVSKEASIFGIDIKPPNINKSNDSFTLDGNEILFGLSGVKGLGVKAVTTILENRPFKSEKEFMLKIPARSCNSRAREALTFAGAFDEFGARDSMSKEEISIREKDILGVSLSHDDLVKQNVKLISEFIDSEHDLEEKQEGFDATIGGEVERIKIIKTKKGQQMAFVDIIFMENN